MFAFQGAGRIADSTPHPMNKLDNIATGDEW